MGKRRRAFTVIELLVATALAALLMAAVLATMSTLAIKSKTLSQQYTASGWQRRLGEQLARDLSNTRLIKQNDGQVTLIGFAALDPESLQPSHQKAELTYAVNPESQLLVRQQRPIDNRDAFRRDVVCANVVGIRIEPLTRSPLVSADLVSSDTIRVPSRVRVVIEGDTNIPVLDRVLNVR